MLIYSQKSYLLTYFEKRRRVLYKGTVLSKLSMRDKSLSLFPFQFDIAFKLLLISNFLQILSLCKIYDNERFIKKLLFQFA